MEGGKYRLAKRMRLAGRIIGFGITGFGAAMLIGEAVAKVLQEGWGAITEPLPVAGTLLIVIGAIALAGCILSWRRERVAGILLIITAAALGAHIGAFAGHSHFLAWSIIGLPYLAAGVLFLNSWRLSKEPL